MKRAWWLQGARVFVGVMAMAAGVGGPAPDVRAFQFNAGDLVLAVYGNGVDGQEYYRDLGPASTLLSPGTVSNFTVPSNALSAIVGGTNWTLIQGQGTTQLNTFINVGSQLNAADTIASGSNNNVVPANTNITSWRNTIGTATGPGSEILLNASDPSSFTTKFGVGGTLNGSFSGGGLQGPLDSVLTILLGQARDAVGNTNILSDAGKAMLLANGQLQICGVGGAGCSLAPIPVPAAVILFGSGLIGLVGIARRAKTIA